MTHSCLFESSVQPTQESIGGCHLNKHSSSFCTCFLPHLPSQHGPESDQQLPLDAVLKLCLKTTTYSAIQVSLVTGALSCLYTILCNYSRLLWHSTQLFHRAPARMGALPGMVEGELSWWYHPGGVLCSSTLLSGRELTEWHPCFKVSLHSQAFILL